MFASDLLWEYEKITIEEVGLDFPLYHGPPKYHHQKYGLSKPLVCGGGTSSFDWGDIWGPYPQSTHELPKTSLIPASKVVTHDREFMNRVCNRALGT